MLLKFVINRTDEPAAQPVLLVFRQERITIGRSPANVLYLHDEDRIVSKQHAEIVISGAAIYLTDLGSTNGTHLNGKRLQAGHPYEVQPGDTIQIGDFEITVEIIDIAALPPVDDDVAVFSAIPKPSPPEPKTGDDIDPQSRDLNWEKEELDKGTLRIEPEEPEADPVRLGASAPRTARPGDEFIARFAAYTPQEEARVEEMLRKLSPRSETHLGRKTCRWQRGARITVRLDSRRLEIDEPEQKFVWEGEYVLLDFGVFVPDEAPTKRTTLTFKVFIDGIVVARFGLDLEITDEETATDRTTTTVEPAHSAFASYASEDALRVVDMVSALSSKAGIDIFWDRFSLKPGDRWKDKLRQEIKERDLFYLFWSRNAKESEWVEWEWRTALDEKGLDAIEPQPLVPPQEAPPPEELKVLHFNDAYMLIRKAIELGSTSG